ncbi:MULTISPECIES: DUF4129 domain-containing protein [Nocardioides]|uniref:DUF4129 domain-containing protein n=1 Tax=Nocardioides vastitatis TaxID=2568655 RepID=A0ABW0ZH72_9ACTN|nr:DUF4129 domain-containing protein [Nocardioides sp.]THI98002.1 DUF4129 domain-containing protein [Nocardioides sp.]
MGNRSPAPLTLGALVLVLCALVAATGDGLGWTGPERTAPVETPAERAEPGDSEGRDRTAEEIDDSGDRPDPAEGPPLERILVWTVLALLAAILVAVLAQLRLMVWRRRLEGGRVRRPGRPHSGEVPDDEDDDEALAEALDAGLDELAVGPPRNAIVAAWLRLERAAVSERFARDPADTPSEFAERVLSSYALDAGAVGRLAALYREARFSEHPISEEQREQARSCLATLLVELRASRSGGRP